MRKAVITIEASPGSPYSASRKHNEPKKEREADDAHDERTWRLHCNLNEKGQVVIPAMALKQAIDTAAYKLGMKIKGRGLATYKGFFTSGLLVQDKIVISNGSGKPFLPEHAEMVAIESNPRGQRGGSGRVLRRFPVFYNWKGTAELLVLDNILTPEVVEHHVKAAGMVVGLGRFRPENGGVNGRFKLVDAKWEELEI